MVHDALGQPLYAGQALLVEGCTGGGAFCHSRDALDRYGAPAGFDLDLLPLALSEGVVDESATRGLRTVRDFVHRHRDAILASVTTGAMPPGPAGEHVHTSGYGRVLDPSRPELDVPLGSLEGDAEREVLRNWLACGSPFVERSTAYVPSPCAVDGECASGACWFGRCAPLGDVVPAIERPVRPTWSSIHTQVLVPSCARNGCHVGANAAAELDLSTLEGAYVELLGAPASTSLASGAACGEAGASLLVPGEPEASLLLTKLGEAPPCGDRMPYGTPLSDDTIGAIRSWIASGALR